MTTRVHVLCTVHLNSTESITVDRFLRFTWQLHYHIVKNMTNTWQQYNDVTPGFIQPREREMYSVHLVPTTIANITVNKFPCQHQIRKFLYFVYFCYIRGELMLFMFIFYDCNVHINTLLASPNHKNGGCCRDHRLSHLSFTVYCRYNFHIIRYSTF